MLVLTRKVTEKIYVGDDVTVAVLEVRGNRVRLGIDAPQAMKIIRAELPREVSDSDPYDPTRSTPSTTPEDETGSPSS